MDRQEDCHTEWSKPDREGEISYEIPYKWNPKAMIQMNLLTKQKQTHKLQEWPYACWGRKKEGGIVREFGMDRHTLLYLKWVTNKAVRFLESQDIWKTLHPLCSGSCLNFPSTIHSMPCSPDFTQHPVFWVVRMAALLGTSGCPCEQVLGDIIVAFQIDISR